jgi:hypothetical protein
VGGVEVVDLEEEADPPGDLVPDRGGLPLPVRLGEQDAGLGAGRADHDPPLRPAAAGGQRGGVLHQVEPQRLGEEGDGLVVVLDDDRDLVQPHEHRA